MVGDFNGWDPGVNPLTSRAMDGALHTTVLMATGRSYEFRYLGENGRWFNDEAPEEYEGNRLGGTNSVLDLTTGAAPAARGR